MFKSKLHFWTFELLMIAVLIFVCTKISFIFNPIVIFVSTLFFPVLVSGFLYFLFRPIVHFLQKLKFPKALAILALYVLFIGVITLVSSLIGPSLSSQVNDLVDNMPKYINQAQGFINELSNSKAFKWVVEQDYVSIEKIQNTVLNVGSSLPEHLSNSFSTIFSVLTNVTLTVVTVPFILYYMLSDGDKFPKALMNFIPTGYRSEGLKILKDTNQTLATYIQGQMIVCLFVGLATFIGYLIIGLPYAIILGIIAALTNIIPYVGPFIGIAPALIVALLDSPSKAIFVIIVVVIVQQIDGNVISPLVIGKKLDTHPLTIIILLLVAGNLAGILGMILAVPVYAVCKTVVLNLVRFIKLRSKNNETPPPEAT
ncbi:AI-2E family transporter [Priestia filamentosa]|uniref:AI-2E family transporter n=1 Tax=Priestia filamentosa TaxID=1402861 RepID=A0A1X7DDP2_9BACI|nr:AI-2E family transporter [Priestia filamentosa]AKO93538.1 AI-2E family transporter [Priestia filamentosa]MDT3763743.1 AI-2E family transporter [Priestia filamentosa]OXS71765.1 AI-2E family transporter [Priestia filamentosa]RJS67410.1 AI-2E family transporter [Priestia filamentosa]WCM14388.1 AI-2E family transporter [Priestia filamentosa]